MTRLDEFKRHFKRGQVYRKSDLATWSKSADRYLEVLVADKTLDKLWRGVYYFPKKSVFGKLPPEEKTLIKSFLKDDRFLLTSLNAYNGLGVGTTQLYNQRIVYNHKRRGDFKLGNIRFSFRLKACFPKKVTPEYLLVDLVNNLDILAEDRNELLKHVSAKVRTMDIKKIERTVQQYGNARTKRVFASFTSSNALCP